ncbi:MAG: tetratricopeptide repeat protein, partial [Anaerolineae bacterium]|nr:tetratricopeptide repeat protein [Anaerolineae bacterium]
EEQPPAEEVSAARPAGRGARRRSRREEQAEPASVEVIDVPLEPTPVEEAPAGVEEQAAAEAAGPSPVPRLEAARRALFRSRLIGPMGLGMLAGCLVFFIIGLGIAGVYQGMRLRNSSQVEAAAQHYRLGVMHLEKGLYELAAAEFEYALRLRPDYPEAQQKLIEARSKASPYPSPTAAGSQSEPSALLTEGRAAYERGAWDESIQKLEALRALDPTYEQSAVDRLLVGAYINSGLKLVNEGSMEEAIRRFDQALALQPDNPDVQLQLRLATLYQGGLSVWGVDWKKTLQDLSAVYALKPDYRDTAERLQRAYVEAGDAAGAESAWCDAVEYYKAALDLSSSPEVAARRDEAAQRCASPGGTPVPSGTYVGAFLGLEDNRQRTTEWSCVRGRIVNANGEGVPNVRVQLSAFDWSSIHTSDGQGYYAFEFLANDGITFTVSLVDLPMKPVDVPAKFGWAAVADFTEKP